MLLTATSFVSRVVVLPLLGRLAERGRAAHLLQLGALGIVPLPALWLITDDFRFLLALQTFAGCAWAAVELATLLVFFDALEQETRTSVLALYNVGSAAAVALGSLLGAGLFVALGADAARLRRAVRRLVDRAHGDAAAAAPPSARRARPAPGELDTLAVRPSARRPPAPRSSGASARSASIRSSPVPGLLRMPPARDPCLPACADALRGGPGARRSRSQAQRNGSRTSFQSDRP